MLPFAPLVLAVDINIKDEDMLWQSLRDLLDKINKADVTKRQLHSMHNSLPTCMISYEHHGYRFISAYIELLQYGFNRETNGNVRLVQVELTADEINEHQGHAITMHTIHHLYQHSSDTWRLCVIVHCMTSIGHFDQMGPGLLHVATYAKHYAASINKDDVKSDPFLRDIAPNLIMIHRLRVRIILFATSA